MIKNKVFYVKEEEYNFKIENNEPFIAKVEIGICKEENFEIIKRIYNGVGCSAYDDLQKKYSNYDALNDYLNDLSSGVREDYQAVEIYIKNIDLIDPKFIELLKYSIKEHEHNVAVYSGGSQKIMSIDIYIKFDGNLV